MVMTSYEFEVAAKNAVVDLIDGAAVQDLQLVWFTHTLGNKKCCIWAPIMGTKYAEVTYSVGQNVMWVDVYEKVYHGEIFSDKFNFEVKSL